MEQEILNIITGISYSDRIKELYDNRSEIIEFPLKIDLPPNYKVISDFSDEYFSKYEYILIENALINALEENNEDYLEFFKLNIKNLKKELENDKSFRNKTTELAIKNISLKLMANHNIDEKIKRNNKTLFENIKKLYTVIEPISMKYRKIILDLLYYSQEDEEIVLDYFLHTNKFDSIIIKNNKNILNNQNINYFKKIIKRLILSDNYLHLQSTLLETELDERIQSINYKIYEKDEYEENLEDSFDDNKDDNFEEDITNDKLIIEYIENCIENNEYILPKDNELRLNMYSKFIEYNLYLDSREYDYETLKEDKEKILKLKKINPLYKLEIINFNN